MQALQNELKGEAERTGLSCDDAVMELVNELRNGGNTYESPN